MWLWATQMYSTGKVTKHIKCCHPFLLSTPVYGNLRPSWESLDVVQCTKNKKKKTQGVLVTSHSNWMPEPAHLAPFKENVVLLWGHPTYRRSSSMKVSQESLRRKFSCIYMYHQLWFCSGLQCCWPWVNVFDNNSRALLFKVFQWPHTPSRIIIPTPLNASTHTSFLYIYTKLQWNIHTLIQVTSYWSTLGLHGK